MKVQFAKLRRALDRMGACAEGMTWLVRHYSLTWATSQTSDMMIEMDDLWPTLLRAEQVDWATWWWLESQFAWSWSWADPRMQALVKVLLYYHATFVNTVGGVTEETTRAAMKLLLDYAEGKYATADDFMRAWVAAPKVPLLYSGVRNPAGDAYLHTSLKYVAMVVIGDCGGIPVASNLLYYDCNEGTAKAVQAALPAPAVLLLTPQAKTPEEECRAASIARQKFQSIAEAAGCLL